MARVLSAKAQDLLALMPPYMTSDPFTQAIVNAYANELQRIEDSGLALVMAGFPVVGDDTVLLGGAGLAAMLSLYETLLLLPVAPAGVSLADRRTRVIAQLQKRHAGEETEWVATMQAALGTTAWSYQEGPADYTVTITLPYASGSFSAGQVLDLARQITPAHLSLSVSYSQGWLAGISLADVDSIT
jgi:hypothetical protein